MAPSWTNEEVASRRVPATNACVLPRRMPTVEISNPEAPRVKRKATAMGTEIDSARARVQHIATMEGSRSGKSGCEFGIRVEKVSFQKSPPRKRKRAFRFQTDHASHSPDGLFRE